jgi:hypothetical protein
LEADLRFLIVSQLDPYARAARTITKYVEKAAALGHEVAVYGEKVSDGPPIPYSLDVDRFDFALFVIYQAADFPNLPYLARLLDGMPKERRVIVDCLGRYNETIRVEHDFNHLEKLDGHQGWEWVEGFEAVSDVVLQPTLHPLRDDVHSFLFHAFDPDAVARPYASAADAGRAWCAEGAKPFGLVYVGNNWQRWDQVAALLQALAPLRDRLGPTCLTGWDWERRPDWAIELGIAGVDVDPDLLARLGVETRPAVPYTGVVDLAGQGRFSPVVHRPLFRHLGLVTTRTFETFCSDTLPLLLLPTEQVEALYGSAAVALVPGDDPAGFVEDALRQPEPYWEAVLATRAHLSEHHSYERRFDDLAAILGTAALTPSASAAR